MQQAVRLLAIFVHVTRAIPGLFFVAQLKLLSYERNVLKIETCAPMIEVKGDALLRRPRDQKIEFDRIVMRLSRAETWGTQRKCLQPQD